MQEPKKIKYRRHQRRRGAFKRLKAQRGHTLAFGFIGLKAQEIGELTSRQIEAARRAVMHSVERKGKVWIREFTHTPVSKKAAEVPMGSGKGALDHYATVVRPGRIIFEMDGIPEAEAREALRLASHKLPLKTKIITKDMI